MRVLQNGEPGAVAAAGGVALFLVTAVPGHPGGGCRRRGPSSPRGAEPCRWVFSLLPWSDPAQSLGFVTSFASFVF